MIGNVIQSLYLSQSDYPAAAALSFVLMALIMVAVLVYIRFAGSEALMGEEAADDGEQRRRAPGAGCASTRSRSSPAWSSLYMLIPIAVIFFFSFNDPPGRYNFTWVGFTLEHWGNAFGIPELNEALLTSLKLAVLATLISTAIGTLMAIALVRHEFFGRRAANFLIVIPMATPEVVMGAALLSFFLILGTFSLGFQTLLIAHVMFCISFVVVVVRSRLIGFDRNLEEAAKDLGAEPLRDLPPGHPAADHARHLRRARCSPSPSRSTTS